jgi:phospholipid-transporting ATPase
MQTFTIISISNGKSAMAMPLAVIVTLSMIKDAYEDYKRHKSDAKENDAITQVLKDQSEIFKDIKWKDVISGDII